MKRLLLVLLAAAGQVCVWAAEQKPIEVAVGQEFKITLESSGATGYQWLLAKPLDENLLKQGTSAYQRPKPGQAKGTEVLNFKALNEGKAEIHLKYGQLFAKTAPSAQNTNFVVLISRSGAAKN